MADKQPSHHDHRHPGHHLRHLSFRPQRRPTSSATTNLWRTSKPEKATCPNRSVNIPRDSALLSLSPGSTWPSSPPTDQRVWEQLNLHQGFHHQDKLSGRLGLCQTVPGGRACKSLWMILLHVMIRAKSKHTSLGHP